MTTNEHLHPSEIVATPNEILMMFYGSNTNPSPTSKEYKANADQNGSAAVLISAVTVANEREQKRKAALEVARERKRQLKQDKELTDGSV